MEIEEQYVEWAAQAANLEQDEDVRLDYSGRAMYGKTCLGIVFGSHGQVGRFVRALVEEVREGVGDAAADELDEILLDGERGDSMGRRSIAYWPSIQVEGHVREATY